MALQYFAASLGKNEKVNTVTNLIKNILNSRSSNESLETILSVTVGAVEFLCQPDRISLFMCDHTKEEVIIVASKEESLKGFTLPFSKGVVGSVAKSGKAEHVEFASSDPRFFSQVDQFTGFVTREILCVPVAGFDNNAQKKKPIAILQVINKHSGFSFDPEDLANVEALCAELSVVLLKHALELPNIKRGAEKGIEKMSIILEDALLFEYGSVKRRFFGLGSDRRSLERSDSDYAHVEENSVSGGGGGSNSSIMMMKQSSFSGLLEQGMPSAKTMDIINDYNLDPFSFENETLIEFAMAMVLSYGVQENFKVTATQLKIFFDVVCSKYRSSSLVYFHNFKHAFGVMHLTYQLMRRGGDKFLTSLECFILLIAALCHDSDHPGMYVRRL